MNAYKIAWQMLHAELRRRLGPHHTEAVQDLSRTDPEVARFAALYQQARAEGIAGIDIMAELCRLAATFAQMTRNPLGAAEQVSRSVMAGTEERAR